jgi:site-specific DNA recombinase
MTPTHTNKKGVRYSYYVSQAALRKQSAEAIGRVPAPELEALVVAAVRGHLQANSTAPNPLSGTDRELIERHLLRATLSMNAITLHLRHDTADAEAFGPHDLPAAGSAAAPPTKLTIPWTVPAAAPVKGIVQPWSPWSPSHREVSLRHIEVRVLPHRSRPGHHFEGRTAAKDAVYGTPNFGALTRRGD